MTVSRQLALCIMFLFGLSIHNFAQVRQCGTMEYLEQQIRDNPERALRLQSIDRQAEQVQHSLQRGVSGTVVIPTVVHIVYRSSSQNISDAQVQSQIDVLNEDFRRLNADAANTPSVFQGVAADTEIEFCLASVDPNGNPTSGITRTASTRTSAFGTNDAVKFASSGGKDAWPAGNYLNIWVCEIGGGILGYAQFPGGSAATDGVVLDYRYTGRGGSAQAPFNLGRTGTHEVGHWLNLRHIWGDGNCNADDFVGDTPTAGAPNYTGSPCTFPGPNSCNQGTGDLPDMFQNYMDYSDDACMNLYTQGQKTRMLALVQPGGFRASLLSSNGCGQGAQPTCTDGIQNGNETGVDCGGSSCPACPCFGNALTLSITLDNYPTETTWRITNSGGSIVASGGPYSSGQRNTTVTQNINLTGGNYTFTILDSYGDGICCAYGNGSYTLSDGTSTIASGGAFGSSESTPFCTGGSGPSCTDGIQNGDEIGVDCGGSCPACPVICDTPAGLSATPAGDQASLSWSPANGALNYNVRARQIGTSTWTQGSNLTPPVNYTGLAACTDYEFQVQSNCSGGTTSNWSASYTFTTTGCSGCAYSTINSSNFDGGWGIWADGGTDCARVNNSTYANSGSYSIQLRDNTSTSVMTTGNLNLTAYSELTVDFTYVAVSMDNSSEDFWLQISTNGGSTYTTVEEWNRGDEFVNNVRYFDAVVIPGPFTANTRLRFRCDASADNDYVYIDDVVISGCGGGARQGAPELAGAGEAPAANEEEHREQAEPDRLSYMKVFPNPATDELSAVFNQQLAGPVQMTVVSTTGQAVYRQAFQADAGRQEVILDVSRWTPGVYVLHLVTDGRTMTQKFVVTGE
ncbi:MAG: T9SS type A sorting domain-containing protein [Phaeodactylibacter sp.]|nr:T9SS type A sorting domain-containing protein [Phaeodactylibacter sp.]